jgi:hypothetical protein
MQLTTYIDKHIDNELSLAANNLHELSTLQRPTFLLLVNQSMGRTGGVLG